MDLLTEHGEHPEAEIDRVTSPGGYTIRGLNKMEEKGFTSAVVAGIRESCKNTK
jgi:pyrroline-5-carboxylate reductase